MDQNSVNPPIKTAGLGHLLMKSTEDTIWGLYANGEVWRARDLYLRHLPELTIEARDRMRMMYFVHLFCSRFIIDERIINVDRVLSKSVDRISEELRLQKRAYEEGGGYRDMVLEMKPVYLLKGRLESLNPGECLAVEQWIANISDFDSCVINRRDVSSWELQVLYFYSKLYNYHAQAAQVMALHEQLFPFSDFSKYARNVDGRENRFHKVIEPISYSFTLCHVAQCLVARRLTRIEDLQLRVTLIRNRLRLGNGSLWKFINV